MTGRTRLPSPARWALRLARIPSDRRSDVIADLEELFLQRRHDRGAIYAHWRLCHDIASLRRPADPAGSVPSLPALLRLFRDVRSDVTYAVRLFGRQPVTLLLTILGLALGLGIATSAFSIMNAAVLRGEGLVESERAPGILRVSDRGTWSHWTYDEFLRLREGATHTNVEAVLRDAAEVLTSSETRGAALPVAFVSGGFFAGTGGRMALGRPLERPDELQTGPPPVVVSYLFWTSALGRDVNAVGRTIRIGRTEAVIVGVAARGFTLPTNRVAWLPLTAYGAVYGSASGKQTPGVGVEVFGRLLPGRSAAEAEAQLSGVAAALPRAADDPPVQVRLDGTAGLGRASSAETFAVALFVFAVIGLVLLLACANVATVLVATAITREREMGVRAALGASRRRIVQQLVTESLAFGAVAAGIGLLLAHWAIPVVAVMIEAPAWADLAPDLRVYLFLGLITLVTGVGAGLAPARHGRGADLAGPLKGEGAAPARLAPRRLRALLVMTQAGVSVILMVLAAFFVRASYRAATIDVGFRPDGLYAVSAGLGRSAFENDAAGIHAFWPRAVPDVQTLPGVERVTLSELTPFGDETRTAITRDVPARIVHFNRTDHGYFATMGLRTLAGRTYTAAEVAANAPVALVSESLARAFWRGEVPIGRLLPEAIPVAGTRPVVIGVVTDAITSRLHERNTYAVYEPLDPASERFASLIVRVASAPGVMQSINERLRGIDATANPRITRIAAQLEREANRPRMLATLTGTVGGIALMLCVIGLYGLTASLAGQRTRELGVRLALGADRRDLLRLLMRDSLKPVALGLALGGLTAVLVGRVVASTVFFGVSPQDPLALAAAVLVLLAAAGLAVLLPSRRAAAVDAAFVLRS